MERIITETEIIAFGAYLLDQERACGTVTQYLRGIRAFSAWLDGAAVTKAAISAWKTHLLESKASSTVNNYLSALHGFFEFLGWEDCRGRYLRLQRKVFRDASRELSREEYALLVSTALRLKKIRLALILETICATGVRVSEVKYITVEAARRGRADISLKGKIRTILIPGKLARKLLKYAKKQKIACGEIFLTASGRGISRRQIWGEMKSLCKAAGVEESKVFPHNLRHLFARAYYKVSRDIVKLADILGHSSIETTRIYLISTGKEHIQQLEQLDLIS